MILASNNSLYSKIYSILLTRKNYIIAKIHKIKNSTRCILLKIFISFPHSNPKAISSLDFIFKLLLRLL